MRVKQLFDDYLVYYPRKGEEGYDGIHNGGIKGLSDDAPEEAIKEFNDYKKMLNKGWKL